MLFRSIESTQGPPRKYYKLTKDGEAFLAELGSAWADISETINHLKKI